MTLPHLVLLWTLVAQSAGNGAVNHALDLDRARMLYASAAYEEALAILPPVPAPSDADFVDQYRGLCLFALGKTTDAEQAFERLISRNPLFELAEDEASPRVVEMVRAVRLRVLPVRAESLYARAKADFEERRYAEAAEGFEQAILFASDRDLASNNRLSDLRLLAEGFRQLARSRAGLGLTPVRFDKPPAPVRLDEDGRELYSILDARVRVPVELDRRMPPWNPPRPVEWRWFRGVIELIINEEGLVERAQLLERIAPFYDDALLEAAKGWRFRPAELDGRPVRFRHRIHLTLRKTFE